MTTMKTSDISDDIYDTAVPAFKSISLDYLRDMRPQIEEKFKKNKAHVYYSSEVMRSLEKRLPYKELPTFSFIFPAQVPDTTMNFYSAHYLPGYKFNNEFTNEDVVTLMKLAVNSDPIRFPADHFSIYINNQQQLRYVDALKKANIMIAAEFEEQDDYG